MLTEKLIAKQGTMGYSDREFGKLLDIPRSTWQAARTGRIALPLKAARRAQRAFPELAIDVLSFLLSDASALATTASPHADSLVAAVS